MRTLIADCGSTKCHWLAFNDGPDCAFSSQGLNPLMLPPDDLHTLLSQALDNPNLGNIDAIHFYGAGCIGGNVNSLVASTLSAILHCPAVHVYSDILAAARATLQHNPGIACILGTGCNSCQYDGDNIIKNIPPLGYILGDEGSGADIGKHVVANALKGLLSQNLTNDFFTFANEDYHSIISHIYSQPRANAYLAHFAHFALQHADDEQIVDILIDRFNAFINRNILLYPANAILRGVGFVGGIAANFSHLLQGVCLDRGITVRSIVDAPINALRQYHSS